MLQSAAPAHQGARHGSVGKSLFRHRGRAGFRSRVVTSPGCSCRKSPLGCAGLTDEQIAAMRDPELAGTIKLPTIEDAVKAGGFLAGRPEDIIEALKAVERRYLCID